ncbi:hypothetical protein ACZ91_64830, partial [Streptomyces regensis]
MDAELPLREQLARALAERAGSRAFHASGRVRDHHRAVWYGVADAVLTTPHEGMDRLRQQLAAAEQRATRAEAALARVRALHTQLDGYTCCTECTTGTAVP